MSQQATSVATIQPNKGLVGKIAEKFGVDPDKLLPALKNTAFRQAQGKEISNEQMMALLIVSNQYGLNPFTKEIFAYPDKGSIVPVVSVDGWSRIINENPQMDGIEFEYSPETVTFKGKTCHVWIDCIIYRKDRSKPIRVREFFEEVCRELSYASPWDTHPNRMHRHKAEIQCARIAFGFAGIYDQDEAERIIEAQPELVQSSPALGQFNSEQKGFFDSLIEKSDAIGMFTLQATLDESVFTNLYHSFEKGSKGKYQRVVNELIISGAAQINDCVTAIKEAIQGDDKTGIEEIVMDMSDDTIKILRDRLPMDMVSYFDNYLSEQAA